MCVCVGGGGGKNVSLEQHFTKTEAEEANRL